MHPLISYDVAKLMLDEHLRDAEGAHRARELSPRSRRHPIRKAVGGGLIALGARLSSQRRTDATGAIAER
jgi:hypothetical protein